MGILSPIWLTTLEELAYSFSGQYKPFPYRRKPRSSLCMSTIRSRMTRLKCAEQLRPINKADAENSSLLNKPLQY